MTETNTEVTETLEVEAPKLQIHALGANVIVKKYEAGDRVGNIFVPSGYMDRPWGEVLSVGPGRQERRIHDGDTQGFETRPICGGRVKVGSLVIYTQGLKIDVPEAGGTLWVVDEDAIVAIVETQ